MADIPRFDPSALAAAANETFTVRRVFGEAYERDGVMVIPVARVWAATGMGQGDGEGGGAVPDIGPLATAWAKKARAAWSHASSGGWDELAEASPEESAPSERAEEGAEGEGAASGGPGGYGGGSGGGGGYGARVKPVGVYVVDDHGVHWRPALDLNRVILGGQLVAVAAVASLATALCVKGLSSAISSAVQAFAKR